MPNGLSSRPLVLRDPRADPARAVAAQAHAARRRGGAGVMKSVAMLPLSTSQRIVTVEVGSGDERRWLVLGVTPTAITTLHTMAPQELGRRPAPAAGRLRPAARPPARRSPETTVPAERIALAEQRRGDAELDERLRARPRPRRLARARRARRRRARRRRLPAAAQTRAPRGRRALPLLVGQSAGGTSYSVPMQTLLFFTALSFLPAVLLLMTSFTRIVIVLSLLRQALGTQAAPPNQVVDRPEPLPHLLRHGADDRQGLRRRLPAVRRQQDRLRRGAQARREPAARLHDEADAPGRRDAVRQARAASTRR